MEIKKENVLKLDITPNEFKVIRDFARATYDIDGSSVDNIIQTIADKGECIFCNYIERYHDNGTIGVRVFINYLSEEV